MKKCTRVNLDNIAKVKDGPFRVLKPVKPAFDIWWETKPRGYTRKELAFAAWQEALRQMGCFDDKNGWST